MTDDLNGARPSHKESILTEPASDITPRNHSAAVRSQAANLLSGLRLILAVAWLLAFRSGHSATTMLGSIALSGAASDLLDGALARRMGTVGALGRWLDSLADIVFVLTALTCEAWAGAIPFYIPILIAISFSQYAIDSMALSGAPIRSRLGHVGGVINFALVIVLGFAPPPALPGAIVKTICPVLAAFYIAAICERVLGYLRYA